MYHDKTITPQVDDLEQQIAMASSAKRLELQPKLEKLLADLQMSGMPVPRRLRNLHEQLVDEAIEARFDNLPI